IKAFLHYVSAEDIVLMAVDESARTVKTPAAARKPIDYLDTEQTTHLLAAYSGETLKSRRNQMLLILLYDTAARVSELTALTLADISFAEPVCVRLTGKRSKSRIVPLSSKTVEHLEVYLAQFHPEPERRHGNRPLFYSYRSGQETALSADSVSLILKNAGDKARLTCPSMPEHLHCHMLRKTKAMDLYKQGVALPLIMQLLGHENMSTTSSFYAFATLEMMRAAMAAGNPAIEEVQQTTLSREELDQLYSLR
ncbi:tyrosine-type recombinase/integrase, partial [Glutamicibacter ardleyensis]